MNFFVKNEQKSRFMKNKNEQKFTKNKKQNYSRLVKGTVSIG